MSARPERIEALVLPTFGRRALDVRACRVLARSVAAGTSSRSADEDFA